MSHLQALCGAALLTGAWAHTKSARLITCGQAAPWATSIQTGGSRAGFPERVFTLAPLPFRCAAYVVCPQEWICYDLIHSTFYSILPIVSFLVRRYRLSYPVYYTARLSPSCSTLLGQYEVKSMHVYWTMLFALLRFSQECS